VGCFASKFKFGASLSFESFLLTLLVGQILGISEYPKDPAACQGGQGGSQAATGDLL
jgi:hypothetical protein